MTTPPVFMIVEEPHVGRPFFSRHGVERDGLEFKYAIRREDGSLLFRTEQLPFAQEIEGLLYETHSPAWVAA